MKMDGALRAESTRICSSSRLTAVVFVTMKGEYEDDSLALYDVLLTETMLCSCEEAINAYRQVFQLTGEMGLYGAFNLVTLLFSI